MSKLISKTENSKLKQNKISTKIRCKKDFEFLMNNFDKIKAELEMDVKKLEEFDANQDSPITLKEYSTEMQITYNTNLKELKEFKKMINENIDLNVVFTKFFETYPYCMPFRNFINK